MNIPVTSRIESLSILCAFVLAGSAQAVAGTEGGPISGVDSRKPPQVDNRAVPKRRASQPHRGSRVSLSANPPSGQRTVPLPPVRGDEHRGDEIAALKKRLERQESLLAAQQQQITQLVASVSKLKESLNATLKSRPDAVPAPREAVAVTLPGEAAAERTGAPVGVFETTASRPRNILESLEWHLPGDLANLVPPPGGDSGALPPQTPRRRTLDQTQPYVTRLEALSREVEGISRAIAGFKFSGDFRIRADGIFRSSNPVAGPQQDVRSRYRARLNFDKGINSRLDVHFQLGSGNFENPLTDNTDFGGGAVKGPIFLSEAWLNYHPNSTLNFQAGKMPEVFQDYTRFIWSNNVRFNGFQESVGTSPDDNLLRITRIDLRAGQYILTNPNIQTLPTAKECEVANPRPACVYLQAGYKPGENVRAANLFDQGVFIVGRIVPGWSHYLFSNFMIFRNPNQIALGSTSAGFPVLVNNQLGVTLAGPLTGTGSATTLPGGGIYTARHYQIGHVAYRLGKDNWIFRGQEFPVFIDLQASRNFGTSFLRNAWMVTLNAGQVTKAGDVRLLYAYGMKEANSMISEFADTQLGTNSGVNIRTHAFRIDLGLARFLQWQNILYIQDEISPNDPARNFYVPLPRGTPTQYRAQSSLFVNF